MAYSRTPGSGGTRVVVLDADEVAPSGLDDGTIVLRRPPTTPAPTWEETFTGTNGAAWPGVWTLGWDGTHTIQDNTGRQVTSATAYSTPNAYRAGVANGDLTARLQVTGTTERYHNLCFRWDPAVSDGYSVTIIPNVVQIKRFDDGAQNTLTTGAFSATTNAWYKIRVQWQGSTLRCKVWPDADPEPGTWLASTTDATYSAANSVQLSTTSGGAGEAITANWDDVALVVL